MLDQFATTETVRASTSEATDLSTGNDDGEPESALARVRDFTFGRDGLITAASIAAVGVAFASRGMIGRALSESKFFGLGTKSTGRLGAEASEETAEAGDVALTATDKAEGYVPTAAAQVHAETPATATPAETAASETIAAPAVVRSVGEPETAAFNDLTLKALPDRPYFAIQQLFPNSSAFGDAKSVFKDIVPEVFNRNQNAMVKVFTPRDGRYIASSGAVMPSGRIATTYHGSLGQVSPLSQLRGLFQGLDVTVPIELRTHNRGLDFASYQAPSLDQALKRISPIQIRPASERLKLGEPLVALGFAKDRELFAYPGFYRGMSELPVPAPSGDVRKLITSEMTIGDGLSGGILFDKQARAAGLVVQGKTSEGLSVSYSVPIGDLKKYWY